MSARETLINAMWKGNVLPERAAELVDGFRRVVRAEVKSEDAMAVRTVAAELGFPLAIVNMLCEDLDGEGATGKDTGGVGQAPAGESTRSNADAAPAERRALYAAALRADDPLSAVIAVANEETDPVYRSGYDTGRMHAGSGGLGGTAVPGFFRPGRVYTRLHHGDEILFRVAYVAPGPGVTYPTAFGWRKKPGEDWEPSDSDDMDGWTEAGEAL